ncbi:glycoside hydrolase family 2 protein [Sanguibacter sp. HDW7]|uniref:glycoside hydrolase family 2 protein n=1 Tax=Sanguibacter sp. HDW7 TaxID=2714931 RepID=UPI00140CEACF|nr:glycoside hydrolase family 2 TIM barrel-domain containing protein [Sanguibacter sp. HDW7]QIK82370.1 glycoside hydrolase family 2 [Sanguibacter sp. HDW7]
MTLRTRWADDVDPLSPLPEHPRPQLVRDRWASLNGPWRYTFVDLDDDATAPAAWDGTITVPFSPEAALSGVGRTLRADQALWYERDVPVASLLPDGTDGVRVLLHLDAVDQDCQVWADGAPVGEHEGGFLPVTCDVTDACRAALARDGEAASVRLHVRVTDDTDASWRSRGKQSSKRGGIWYTPQSGIWQSVWLEVVPVDGVGRLVLVPHLTGHAGAWEASVDVSVEPLAGREGAPVDAAVEILDRGAVVASGSVALGGTVRLDVPDPRPWSPEDPHLYDVRVRCGDDDVTSYVGLRSFGVGPDADGTPRLLLNGEPYFHAGVLDQGYWPDGLLTAPTDEALLADVVAAKELGFTMVRKHIKVEPMRWYHHCDRTGLLVWQDMVNGGGRYLDLTIRVPVVAPLRLRDHRFRLFARSAAEGRAAYRRELVEMIEHLRSVPSICVWVPFNEGWGQFDAAAVAREVAALDPTRVVDHASGWHDQRAGDLRSLHVYFRRFRVPRRLRGDRRALVLSEYGGYNLRVPGRTWGDVDWGYARATDAAELQARFESLHDEQIVPAIPRGLSATVYTQLTDVEDELNGLLTYDRADKLDRDAVRAVNARLTLGR